MPSCSVSAAWRFQEIAFSLDALHYYVNYRGSNHSGSIVLMRPIASSSQHIIMVDQSVIIVQVTVFFFETRKISGEISTAFIFSFLWLCHKLWCTKIRKTVNFVCVAHLLLLIAFRRSYLGQKVNPDFFFEFVLLLGDNNNSVEICRAFYHLLVGMHD